MIDDAISALKEIQQWLGDRRDYLGRHRLWPAQHAIFERLRRSLKARPYDLAELAQTIETPSHERGVRQLREIFEDALELTDRIAESEFFGIRELMPKFVRYEIEVFPNAREISSEYFLKSDSLGAEIVLAKHGEIEHWGKLGDEFILSRGVISYGSASLFRMLDLPNYGYLDPRLNWAELNQSGALREVNAAGNMAAHWLADGVSRAVANRLRGQPRVKELLVERLEAAGIVDPEEAEELQIVGSILRSFKDAGRIFTWVRTDTGFIIDGFHSTRPLREGDRGYRISVQAERANSVKVSINRVYIRTVADPVPEVEPLDEYSAVVSRAELSNAVVGHLNLIVGFPPSSEFPNGAESDRV